LVILRYSDFNDRSSIGRTYSAFSGALGGEQLRSETLNLGHPGQALLHRVDARLGITDADYVGLGE
jgi:hypothetical protein